jgi:hypothetical protein
LHLIVHLGSGVPLLRTEPDRAAAAGEIHLHDKKPGS